MAHCFPVRLAAVSLGLGVAFGLTTLSAQYPSPPPTKADAQAAEKQSAEAAKKAEAEAAANLAKLDAVPGFRGLAFGTDFATVKKGFEVEQDRGPLVIYKKSGEKLALGPVLLETVLYYVFEGKFYGVALHTNDGQDSLNLQSVLIAAFGPGKTSAQSGPGMLWLGRKVGAIFEVNTSTGDGNAFLFDQSLHDAYLKSESAAAAKAASALLKGE